MTSLRLRSFGSIAALLFLVPAGLCSAQSAQKWSLQASVLYVGVSGDAYEGLSNGIGGEFQVRFTPNQFSIGIGGQASNHDLDLTDVGFGKETVMLSGGFIEPRYVFDLGKDKWAPYASARVAVLQQTLTVEDVDLSAKGTQLNIGGGILLRMSPRVNLDLGATFGKINFDDVTASSGGQTITVDGTSGSGQNLVLRFGIAFGLR